MNLDHLLPISSRFADELAVLAAREPEQALQPPAQAALDEAKLALEHWRSVGGLLQHDLLPSALAVQLEQIDSLTRALWVRDVATEEQVRDFVRYLSLTRDQGQAASTPAISDMMGQLKGLAAKNRYYMVSGAREARWTYSRPEFYRDWRSKTLIADMGRAVLFNSNGIGALAGIVISECITGSSQEAREVLARHTACVAPHANELLTSDA